MAKTSTAVAKKIQALYKKGVRRYPAILKAMKKSGAKVSLAEIGAALKPLKSKAEKAAKPGRKKKRRGRPRKAAAPAAPKRKKKRRGRPKKAGRPRKTPGRPRQAAAPATPKRAGGGAFLIATPRGRGMQTQTVNGWAALSAKLEELLRGGADMKKVGVYRKIM